MGKKRNYYTASKKAQIALAAIEGSKTQAQLTSEYGLFYDLDQTEMSGCSDNEQNRFDNCQNCLINGFKLRARPKKLREPSA